MNKITSLPLDFSNIKIESVPEYPEIGDYDMENVPTYSELDKDSKVKQVVDAMYNYLNITPVSNYEIFSYSRDFTYKKPKYNNPLFCNYECNYIFSYVGTYECSHNNSAYDYESTTGLIFNEIPESINLILEYGHLIDSPIKKKWYNICGTKKVFITESSVKIVPGKLYIIPEFQRFRVIYEELIPKTIKYSMISIQTRHRRPFCYQNIHQPNTTYNSMIDGYWVSHPCKY